MLSQTLKENESFLCFSTKKLFIIHLFMSTFKQHICTLFYNGFYNVLTTVSVMFFGETENDLINLSHSLSRSIKCFIFSHFLSLFLLCSVLDFFCTYFKLLCCCCCCYLAMLSMTSFDLGVIG